MLFKKTKTKQTKQNKTQTFLKQVFSITNITRHEPAESALLTLNFLLIEQRLQQR